MNDAHKYMLRSDAIVGYTWAADIVCPACVALVYRARVGIAADSGMSTESILDLAAAASGIADRFDEGSYDSGDFPKVVLAVMVESSDERCASCGESLIGD